MAAGAAVSTTRATSASGQWWTAASGVAVDGSWLQYARAASNSALPPMYATCASSGTSELRDDGPQCLAPDERCVCLVHLVDRDRVGHELVEQQRPRLVELHV